MSCRALGAVLLLGLTELAASAECAPQVRLRSVDPGLLAKIQSALGGTELRSVSDRYEDQEGDWTCPVLEVSLAQAGDRIEIVAQDASGTTLERTVLEAETAVALIESWTVTQPQYRARHNFSFSIRPELAFGGRAHWAADPAIAVSASLLGDWLLELNLRAGLTQLTNDFALRGAFEAVAGTAWMFRFEGWALCFAAGVGLRQVTGQGGGPLVVLEPAASVLYSLSRNTNLELRVAPQTTYLVGSSGEQWALGLRVGAGFRWSLR